MAGLVLELQADALDRNVHVSDLLRKALVVSKKLGVTHIEAWLRNELNGYTPDSEIPHYREVHGQIRVWNPYHGWQPLNFANPEMAESLSKRKIMQPIGELDSLTQNRDDSGLEVPFPQHIVNSLMKSMSVELQPTLHVALTEVVGILDAVRNNALDWALQLEQEGIIGEGMSFSNEEKKTASQVTYQITNNIGSMQHSQIQQDSPRAIQKIDISNDIDEIIKLVSDLKSSIDKLGLSSSEKQELEAELETIESQTRSPRPKKSILAESLQSVRSILEGIAGNIVTSGFLTQLARFF